LSSTFSCHPSLKNKMMFMLTEQKRNISESQQNTFLTGLTLQSFVCERF
jgi:hypothetical protein